jgi:tetratricopeptide (TPR) repeat protein
MTDALIGHLSRIRALRVISRTSVMSYKGAHKSERDIAHELGVATIAEGSVLRTGNRMRISLQLVDAPNDRPIWSGNYEGELNDIVDIPRDMAEAIIGQIHVTLTAPERAYLARTEHVNLAAYDTYLKGRHQYLTEFTQQSMQKAIDLFQHALAIDPSYAAPYLGLAECYSMASGRFYPPDEMMPKARSAVLKAISIDELLGGAHATLAYIRSVYEYDRAEAEKGFRRAIELEPSNAELHGDDGRPPLHRSGRPGGTGGGTLCGPHVRGH